MKKLTFQLDEKNVIEIIVDSPGSGSITSNLLDDYRGHGPAGVGVEHDNFYVAVQAMESTLLALAVDGQLKENKATLGAIQTALDKFTNVYGE